MAMAAPGSLVVWRAVFAGLGLLMVATLVYTCATDGSPFRPDLLTPWLAATLVDFYVNVIAISAWVIYREANWISSAIWVVLLVCFGSAATCAYIVKKLFEVTPGPSQDPLDLQLLRQGNMSQRNCHCVIIGRIIFSILGIFMAAIVTYTVITDGLPFRKELLTPWMAATLIDFYINVFAISHHNMWLHCHSTFPCILSRPDRPRAIELPQQVRCSFLVILHLEYLKVHEGMCSWQATIQMFPSIYM